MTRSAPESPGRGCPIAIAGKNSMPHTAYYPTVELLVEFQIGTSNADESVHAFGEKITTVIEYTPTQQQLPWHENYLYWKRTCLRQSSHLEALSVHSMSKSGGTYPNTNLAVQSAQSVNAADPLVSQSACQAVLRPSADPFTVETIFLRQFVPSEAPSVHLQPYNAIWQQTWCLESFFFWLTWSLGMQF